MKLKKFCFQKKKKKGMEDLQCPGFPSGFKIYKIFSLLKRYILITMESHQVLERGNYFQKTFA